MRRPGQVIDRAGWLLWNQPPPYRLGYRNGESIAMWCATGEIESFQVKWFMLGRVPLPLLTIVLLMSKPSIGGPLMLLGFAVSLATAVPYIHSWAFFHHTGEYLGTGKWTPEGSPS
jgi:hypothetical protein